MNNKEFLVERMTTDLVNRLVERYDIPMPDALRIVYNSETYHRLCDPNTELYFQSPVYVFSYLDTELKTGRIA